MAFRLSYEDPRTGSFLGEEEHVARRVVSWAVGRRENVLSVAVNDRIDNRLQIQINIHGSLRLRHDDVGTGDQRNDTIALTRLSPVIPYRMADDCRRN